MEIFSLADHYRMFGHYNAWANARLYAAASNLTEAQYREDRGAFFKSVHGTLNHLLVSDRIWLHRLTGEGQVPDRLDAILFESLDSLAQAREHDDRRIVAFAEGLDDVGLFREISYRRGAAPELQFAQVAPVLAHWFNHQTHHRGQVHVLMSGLVGVAPVLDLRLYQRLAAHPAD